ncbi:MAG TPA: tRNA adenosine(34) deaminase TadA [Actinomycetota bacterium]|nr:tRNA adenosine(34) deaminase TadA [Actinomycetota bacterium]
MNDEEMMKIALEQAHLARERGDVPIGAVAVAGGKVIAKAGNERELSNDPTAHAELLVLKMAADVKRSWRLRDVTIYVTLEPCPMCAGAMIAARVKRLVYGAADLKAGGVWSLYNIPQDPRLNHHVEVTAGVMEEECSLLLTEFFRRKRRKTPTL